MTTRRRPAVLALLVILGAAALAGASALTWWTQTHLDALSGALTTTAKGSQTDALLIPVALIGLAGFGAALATTGGLRRAVGVLLLVGGGLAAGLSVSGLLSAPASLHTDLLRPVESSGPAQLQVTGPVLGVIGGVLIAVAGLLVGLGYGARRGLGARYDAPRRKQRAPQPAVPADLDPAADADAAAGWWKALDAGQDPTGVGVDPAVDTSAFTSTDDSAADVNRGPSGYAPGVSGDLSGGG
ncbi:MAG: Trp biosynthesis-associated membrane protein [Actinomycetota bacterium]|nr:Trp biosynthesis-associated membrane protein [Actinomycetota bacterium]